MFRRLTKNKKAQNTAEYAILISLVVAGIVAMQTYAQRALQARVRDASSHMTSLTGTIGNTYQYEPYYLTTDYNVVRDDRETQLLGLRTPGAGQDNALVRHEMDLARNRTLGGFQESAYSVNTHAGGEDF